MHDIASYQKNLMIYIFVIGIVLFVIFSIVNLILFVLKHCKVFYEKRITILVNLIGFLILVASVVPAILDICQSSYCKIPNVVNIEEFKTKYSDKEILITDKDGVVYTCYDYLIDTEALESLDYPGTVVYAKHSKLMLDYYSENS